MTEAISIENSSTTATSSAASSFRGRTIAGLPRGVLLLSFTELWERFSYYGMLAILVLYLSTSVQEGGFGWSDQSALKLYGLYSGLAFTLPLLGGWIANMFLGERRCILLGGVLITLGHGLIALPTLIPLLSHHMFGMDFAQLLRESGAPLGYVLGGEPLAMVRESAARAGVSPTVAMAAYLVTSGSFFGGLASIIAGTALLKPTISSIVGRFYDDKDPRRDTGFAVFLVGIYFGVISGTLIVGLLGERAGWHLGFGAAGIGMTIGLIIYVSLQRRYLGDLGVKAEGRRTSGNVVASTAAERDRIKCVLIITAFATIYAAVVFQFGGLFILIAKTHVDRARWGWEIPSSWFIAAMSITCILATPALAWLWERLAARGHPVRTSLKLACGLIVAGIGYLVVAYPVITAADRDHYLMSPVWFLVMHVLFGLAEAVVWAGVISFTTRLAPKRFTAMFVGGTYLSMGVGTWLAGYIGALSYSFGVGTILVSVAILSLSAGALLYALRGRLARLTHGIEP